MDYRFVDRTQAGRAIRREDALRACIVAAEAEIIAASVNGEGKDEADEKARTLRGLADGKCGREEIADDDRATAVREYLADWCPALEQRHLEIATTVELRAENEKAGATDDEERELRNLGAMLTAAYEVLDDLPTSQPKLNGDGGTRSRQAKRAAARKRSAPTKAKGKSKARKR